MNPTNLCAHAGHSGKTKPFQAQLANCWVPESKLVYVSMYSLLETMTKTKNGQRTVCLLRMLNFDPLDDIFWNFKELRTMVFR